MLRVTILCVLVVSVVSENPEDCVKECLNTFLETMKSFKQICNGYSNLEPCIRSCPMGQDIWAAATSQNPKSFQQLAQQCSNIRAPCAKPTATAGVNITGLDPTPHGSDVTFTCTDGLVMTVDAVEATSFTKTCLNGAFGGEVIECKDTITHAGVQKTTPANMPDDVSCSLPEDQGRLCTDEWQIKWFYNTAWRECERFWYGGCEGNGNRYDNQAECEGYCKT